MEREIYRILDANINRAREGLRVLEDFSRFTLKEKEFTKEIKKIRHRLKIISKEFGDFSLLNSRCVEEDPGKEINIFSEYKRKDYLDIILTNFKRTQESLRVLEEYSKLINSKLSYQIKKMRFEIYTLEKNIVSSLNFSKKLSGLYVIVDKRIVPISLTKISRIIIEAGVSIIQLRCKNTSLRNFLKEAKLLRKLTKEKNMVFIINDSVEIAQAVDAEGVHLGDEDMPISIARKILGVNKIIGASVSTPFSAEKAEKEGANYLGVGAIFETSTKENAGEPKGVEIIRKIKRKVNIPVFAIGGINRNNLKEVLKSGADGVCISSAILLAKNPYEETKKIIKLIQKR